MSFYWQHVLALAGVNALVSWGLSLAIRSGQLSVGHAAFAGLGGYGAGILTRDYSIPLPIAVAAGALLVGGIGGLVRLIFIRLNHLLFAIATLGIGQIASVIVTNVWPDRYGGAAGLTGIPLLVGFVAVAACVLVALVVEAFILRGSSFDFRLRLSGESPLIVGLGKRSWRWTQVLGFALSAGIAAFAGGLAAHVDGVVQPTDLEFGRSFDILVFAIVGGASSGYGALIGGAVLTLVPEALAVTQADRTLLYGAVLFLVVVLMRHGVLPRIPVPVVTRLSPTTRTARRGVE